MLREQVFAIGALLVIPLWITTLYLNHKTFLNLVKTLEAINDKLAAIGVLITANNDVARMRTMFFTSELPSHCFSCGVPLEGGATQHKADCAVRQLIEKHFPKVN